MSITGVGGVATAAWWVDDDSFLAATATVLRVAPVSIVVGQTAVIVSHASSSPFVGLVGRNQCSPLIGGHNIAEPRCMPVPVTHALEELHELDVVAV